MREIVISSKNNKNFRQPPPRQITTNSTNQLIYADHDTNIDFVSTYGPGFDIQRFIQLANINAAARSLSRDLFVGAGAVTLWIVIESKRLKMRNLWIIYISFLIAFAFAAPLFLFLREKRLIEIEQNELLL